MNHRCFKLYVLILCVINLLSFNRLYAQGTAPVFSGAPVSYAANQLPVKTAVAPPTVVNFQQLAAYDLAHPQTLTSRAVRQLEEIDDDYQAPRSVIPAGAPVTNIIPYSAKALVSSPAPTGSWDGTLQNQNLIPPDIRGAASSGNWVLETNNEQFDVWNKTGGHLNTVLYGTFFNSTGGSSFFDPHVIYDANYNRFVVCSGGNTSNGDWGIFVAVSQTNDPTGNWSVYTAVDDGVSSPNGVLDYPLMGLNNNWVVVTARDFSTSNVIPQIYVMDRASLYSGTLGTVNTFTDQGGIVLGPAQTYDATQNTEYLVANANGNSGGNGYMQVAYITGTATAPVYNAGGTIGVSQTWDENPPLGTGGNIGAPQSGGNTLEIGDTRTGNAVFINGSLWFTHTVFLPTGNPTYAGVDWWQVNPSSLTVQQYGRVSDGTGTKFYFYPSINVNSNGDALLGYCESSPNIFAGAAYSFHASADALNSMERDTIYKPGVFNYVQTLGGNRNRYGDFTGTATDPTDGSFWNFSEWANTDGSNSLWGTVVAHVPASSVAHVAPVANFVANTTTSCSGLIQFTDLSTGSPTTWVWDFGDGTTSGAQNPAHLYMANGTYTVKLTASNTYGPNTKTISSYVTISAPAGPSATGASHCGASTFSLSATTSNHVGWHDSTGAVVSGANPFVTPTLSRTTAYWVTDTVPNTQIDSVGPAANTTLSTTGGFFSNATDRYLTFDALAPFTLVSVTVYAQAAGTRIIEFRNSAGTVLQNATVTLAMGENVVTLNFNIPTGTGYQLGVNGSVNPYLYRNNDGGSVNYYPLTYPGVVSITGSNAGAGYYYFFYNWKFESGYCISLPTKVTALVSPAIVQGFGSVVNDSCHGSSTGSATIAVTGGTPGFTYHWSNGQTGVTATNLAAATYSYTVTDAANCTTVGTKTVSEPGALNISVTPTAAGCGGATNGSAAASVTGGTPGYSYLWNTGASGGTLSNVAAGSYTLKVTDALACTATTTAIINSSGTLNVVPTATNLKCHGDSTGSVTISVSGSTGSVNYTWSTGSTAQSINNLPIGTYSVTVSDGSGCSAIESKTLTEPAALALTLAPTNAGCGASLGTVTANVSGGTLGYSYSWSNSGTTDVISGLAVGPYSVTVTDNHSCKISAATTVNAGSTLVAVLSSGSPTCFGLANGTANSIVTTGSSPYTYLWSTGAITSSISNIVAGTYYLTITDANNCPQADSVVVSQPQALSLNVVPVQPTCHGSGDGSATATTNGGTAGYTYNWSNSQSGPGISGLGGGSYSVTVQDSHSCSVVSNFSLTDPAAINVVLASANDSCYGSNTGNAQLTTTGGVSPYTYLWSNSDTSANVNGLAAGSYGVTITDNHHCSVTTSASITEPGQLQIYTSSTDDLGTGNGTARVDSVTGGTPPFSIVRWSSGQTTNPAVSLAAGTYTVTVTDKNGCRQTGSATVNLFTGISNTSEEVSFNVYPNPARTQVIVDQHEMMSKESELSLQDVLGQTLLTMSLSASQTRIDLTSFANGVYFISLKQGDKKALKKFVLSK